METDEFIGLIQANLLNSNGKESTKKEVLLAVEAILKTFSETLAPGQKQQLAASLPLDISTYLSHTEASEHDTLDAFFHCVALREGIGLPQAIHHSRTVIAVLQKAIPVEVMGALLEQIPSEFGPLFQ